MHLVRLIAASQRIHDEIDAEAIGGLALSLSARHHSGQRAAALIHRPGRGPIVSPQNYRGDAVVPTLVSLFDPEVSAGVAARKLLKQVKGLGEDMIRRHLLEWGQLQPGGNLAQAFAHPVREAFYKVRTQQVDYQRPTVI